MIEAMGETMLRESCGIINFAYKYYDDGKEKSTITI